MYEAFINGYRLADVSHGKSYYVYCIEVLESKTGTQHFIERRYSEFSALHRKVHYRGIDVKKFMIYFFSNYSLAVTSQKSIKLEYWTKFVHKINKFSKKKQLILSFFNFSRIHKAADNSVHNHPNTLGHHPVLTFHCDPYVPADSTSSLSDVVTNGVLLGIYKS
ncbi:SNX24 protein, partial [Pseudoatta argentina]